MGQSIFSTEFPSKHKTVNFVQKYHNAGLCIPILGTAKLIRLLCFLYLFKLLIQIGTLFGKYPGKKYNSFQITKKTCNFLKFEQL